MVLYTMKNIYYIGYRQGDAEASFFNQTMDGYFAGSITELGNNKRGNIAHNATTRIQLSQNVEFDERNTKIMREFINEKCREIVAKVPDAYFYPYSPVYASYVPDELKDRILCCNDPKVFAVLDSKFQFRKIFKDILPFAPYEYVVGSEIIKRLKDGTYPDQKEVVIQRDYGAGGFGTLVVSKKYFEDPKFKERSIKEIYPRETYLVSDYIESICSTSLHMIVSNNEVHLLPSSYHRYIDHHKLDYVEFKAFNKLPKDMLEQAYEYGRKFGEFVRTSKKYRMRGWVHIDLLFGVDGKVYTMEANPRFGGEIGLENRVFRAAGLESVFEYNYRAFYDEKTDFGEGLKKVKPLGIYRHAVVKRNADGELVSVEADNVNREGFDMTLIREEDGMYTHSVYELQTEDEE